MANYREDFANINLETGTISRNFMNHSIGGGDALGDRFGVRVFRNGEAVTLGGTCAGLCHSAGGVLCGRWQLHPGHQGHGGQRDRDAADR